MHVMCRYISSGTRSLSGLLCKNAGMPEKPENLRCFSFPFRRHDPFKWHRTASRHAFHSDSLKCTYILSSVGLTVVMHIICGCCPLQFVSFQKRKKKKKKISPRWERNYLKASTEQRAAWRASSLLVTVFNVTEITHRMLWYTFFSQ